MKKIKFAPIILSLLFCIVGCANQAYPEVIHVVSTDYADLKTMERGSLDDLDIKAYETLPYDGYLCVVSKTNVYGNQAQAPQVVVNNERTTREHSYYGNNGYFIGRDYTEFASGITFFPFSGLQADQKGNALPTGRCVALLEPNNSGKRCFAVTSWNYHDISETANAVEIYELKFPTAENPCYASAKVCHVASGENALAATVCGDTIYVATENSLYLVTSEYEVEKIEVPEKWGYLSVNSMVCIGDILYIGTRFGVLTYDCIDGFFSWYPMSYSEHIK